MQGIRHAAEAFHLFLKSNSTGHSSYALKSARRSVVTSPRAVVNESGQVETLGLPNGMISARDLTYEQAIVVRLLGQVLEHMRVTAAGRSLLEAVATFPVPSSV
jgi:hypothetical protein